MKRIVAPTVAALLLLSGCTSSPRSQDMVRRTTAAVTRTAASNLKGAALGVMDGLRPDPGNTAVDVNHASRDKLQALPGVTPQMADRIIDNRPYKKPSDLVRRRILPKAVYGKSVSRLVAH